MTVLLTELLEIFKVTRPSSFLSIPSEAKLVEDVNSLLGDTVSLSVFEKLVLLSVKSKKRPQKAGVRTKISTLH